MASDMGATCVAFFKQTIMNIYIYSDESGVFDYRHDKYFVFGGIICFGNSERDKWSRLYSNVEKTLRESKQYDANYELKASNITNIEKGKLFRSLNGCYKFAVIIDQEALNKNIFNEKKHKQRYLDFAYKMVLRKCLETLIVKKKINSLNIDYIYVYADEHNTATDGIYELEENLRNEFKYGTFNMRWDVFHEPIIKTLKDVCVKYCNSKKNTLVRAADIVANHFYHKAIESKGTPDSKCNSYIYLLPQRIVVCNGLEFNFPKDS